MWESDHNLDKNVIRDFGKEWAKYNFLDSEDNFALDEIFSKYTACITLADFTKSPGIAADFGAGSGRWTERILQYFSKVYALEPAGEAVNVLEQRFKGTPKVTILKETVGSNSIPDATLDFAMSLGVLHHIPDTGMALKKIAEKLKPGATLLCYLYYKLDDKPLIFRLIFKCSNIMRKAVSKLPFILKKTTANLLALLVYYPLSRSSRMLFKMGFQTKNIPLQSYKDAPFKIMLNDSLDRFGTSLEQRFDKDEIKGMLGSAGFDLSTLKYSDEEPFWTFSVKKLAR